MYDVHMSFNSSIVDDIKIVSADCATSTDGKIMSALTMTLAGVTVNMISVAFGNCKYKTSLKLF